ncbi:MAG: hypothetical protein KIS92_23150 [Planctomycetota bacterium]|nr:hypothetical protein [Planctomycetota bacterium]
MAVENEVHAQREAKPAQQPEGKIEGELTLADLSQVTGGTIGPVINGKSYSPLKSRFGIPG